ncbi:MAG: hypothetical protein AB1716_19775 [Planctomycetota bacterium]
MKMLRIKKLALAGTGLFMLQVAGCAPLELISNVLEALRSLIPVAA